MPVSLQPLPDAAAIRALKARGATLLESWDWQDVGSEVHKQAWTVAKSAGFDILGDVHASLEEALANGETFPSWAKRIRPTLAEKGWWGRKELADPVTGEVREVQLGSPRRLRTIYDTNMRVSHAQGRWERTERLAARRPYLRYVATLDERTRASHRSWHGTVLRWDDPWWDTHYPPNGWRCRCSTVQLGEADLKRYGFTPTDPAPNDGPGRVWTNPRTGETQVVPPGIDPGWAHNPGRRPDIAQRTVTKLAPLPPAIASQAPTADPGLIPRLAHEHADWVDEISAAMRAKGEVRSVGLLSDDVVAGLDRLATEGVKGARVPRSAVITLGDTNAVHWLRDAKAAARTAQGLPKALTELDLKRLPGMLAVPEAVLWDTQTESLLYVFSPTDPVDGGGRKAKAVVRIDSVVAIARERRLGNPVTTGGYEQVHNLRSKRYRLISGKI
ncbi:Mu-like prophage FluMu F protein [uncultured Alphaproteobacteria bacterium]|uniref:Mu-like prophage FluMu F protein n=1 Tax=uncultured Alphaproteobacteria bacterium TaxID=91750 RepID=A0A212KN25_9PROT|nr:Mu-like prophage FluMu F protein [uncultured Alphaproteobacteria bacterium]